MSYVNSPVLRGLLCGLLLFLSPRFAPAQVAYSVAGAGSVVEYQTSGTIGALNGTVDLDCPGAQSAVIAISGTFNGTLTALGSGDLSAVSSGIWGGRLLFKSGVGSLGTNTVTGDGSVAMANEYRVVVGGRALRLKMTAYTSGTATIRITASAGSSITFANGPTHNALEEATRAGRAFSVSTSIQSVAAGNYLNTRFSNPAGSGKNCFVVIRRFDNNYTQVSEYYGVANPVALTSPTTVTPSNLDTGGVASVVTFTWNMGTTRLDSSPTTASPVGGVISMGSSATIETARLIRPGQSFGHYIGGSGGGLGATARLGVTLNWYEEAIN